MGMDTIVTFQNGAWHARHAGCYCDVSKWRRFGTDTPKTSFSISRAEIVFHARPVSVFITSTLKSLVIRAI